MLYTKGLCPLDPRSCAECLPLQGAPFHPARGGVGTVPLRWASRCTLRYPFNFAEMQHVIHSKMLSSELPFYLFLETQPKHVVAPFL